MVFWCQKYKQKKRNQQLWTVGRCQSASQKWNENWIMEIVDTFNSQNGTGNGFLNENRQSSIIVIIIQLRTLDYDFIIYGFFSVHISNVCVSVIGYEWKKVNKTLFSLQNSQKFKIHRDLFIIISGKWFSSFTVSSYN